jgi:hypothetical protein
MAKYLVINKNGGDYFFYFSDIHTNDIEEAYNVVYNNTLNNSAEHLADALYDEQPNDFEDMDTATDVAYDMIKNQWADPSMVGVKGDYVVCIDKYKDYGLLILNNKNELWNQLQRVELLNDLDYKISNHTVDIVLDNIRKYHDV